MTLVACAVLAVVIVNDDHLLSRHRSPQAREARASAPTARTVTVSQSTASAAPRPAGLTGFQGPVFTVDYPSGWTQTEDDVQKSGYVESKWTDPDGSGAYVLVDDTPGYAGTPEAGAQSVRDQVASQDGYHQLAWRPSVDGWLWQFVARGVEQADTFKSACNTGMAVLESAPSEDWAEDESRFTAVTTSFVPSPCD